MFLFIAKLIMGIIMSQLMQPFKYITDALKFHQKKKETVHTDARAEIRWPYKLHNY